MEPHVKGQTLKSLLLFMQQRLQPSQIDRALDSIDAEARRQIDRGILPTSTFPMSMVNRLTVEGARASATPVDAFARDAGSFSASEAVKGVYRFFARALTTDALLTRAASMWSAMNTAGKMEVSGGKGMATVRLLEYPSDPVMCMRIDGWIQRMAEMTGEKDVVVRHVACAAKGAAQCEWSVTW